MQDFFNFSMLKAYNPTSIPDGTAAYVSGYNYGGDGGGGIFVYRNSDPFTTHAYYSVDNGGTLLKPNNVAHAGIWVRQLDGHISVAYFGALGFAQEVSEGDYTIKFQKAIENAYQNSLPNPPMKGSVVYVPNGAYILDTLNLRSGISLIGESFVNTILYSMATPVSSYLFTMDRGPVIVNMANFNLVGRQTAGAINQGCFHFKALPPSDPTEYQHGGLWSSTFKNIQATNFKGIGTYLEGGANVSPQRPNQFNIFENFRMTRTVDNVEALKMTGQQGQITFLNCQFDGIYSEGNGYSKGHNVLIKNNGDAISGVISFINSTVQVADYGMVIEFAENVTIDNCWFENLGVAITVRPDTASPNYICKSINIHNNRFANAAGYGILDVPSQNIDYEWGSCIQVSNSQVNVHNNYATPVRADNTVSPFQYSLFLQVVGSNLGVSVSGNSAATPEAGRTYGIMQVVAVDTDTNSIDCKYNKVVFVTNSATVINTIFSGLAASETIFIRANGGSVKFDNTGNINFSNMNLSGSSGQLILNNGEEAVFTKIDNTVGAYKSTYQLTSLVRYTTP